MNTDFLLGFGAGKAASGGGGSSVDVEPLSVTENGTYTADTGKAYSPVTVNVQGGGGASNFVTGTFTTPSTTSSVNSVTIPYTGSGYPIMLVVTIEGGFESEPWASALVRYAVGQHIICKYVFGEAPDYSIPTTSPDADKCRGTVQALYRNSDTSSINYSSTRSGAAFNYDATDPPTGSANMCVKITSNTTFEYITCGGTSSTYGLSTEQTYRYVAVYSS